MDDISFDAFVGANGAVFLSSLSSHPFDVFSFVYPLLLDFKYYRLSCLSCPEQPEEIERPVDVFLFPF